MRSLGYPVNLIICQKSKIGDWCKHFEVNYPKCKMFDLTHESQLRRYRQLALFNATFPVVGIINYELAWRRASYLDNLPGMCLMLDESSLIQNRTAKQTRFILKLKPEAVILLSGTPTSGKYENLWTQAHLLGWPISEKLYQSTFVNWETIDVGAGMPIKRVSKVHPYKNVDRLKQRLRDYGAVFMKTEDVLDMPEQSFQIHEITKPAKYDRFMRDGIVRVGNTELVGDTALTKRLRARQLCGQYSDEKLQAFRDLLQSTGDRVVVFYNFTPELEKLLKVCADLTRPTSIVNGEEKNLDAYENDGDSVTLCQYQAGAMGLNLQKANRVIYYTLPERSDLFEQSKKRIHRIGQTRPCFYHVLMCRGTLERGIWRALEQRRDYTDELFREEVADYGR